jgi:hypothetical protein
MYYRLQIIGSQYTGRFTHRRDDGGSKHLWNVSKLLPDIMAPTTQKTAILTFQLFLVEAILPPDVDDVV